MSKKRYFLDTDDSGNWYIVPVERREDFESWQNQDWQHDLSDFQPPDYAEQINGTFNYVTFTNPVDES